jgi:hypothetical protein
MSIEPATLPRGIFFTSYATMETRRFTKWIGRRYGFLSCSTELLGATGAVASATNKNRRALFDERLGRLTVILGAACQHLVGRL